MHKLIIPGTNHPIYVNPRDLKGASLMRYKGMTQPRIVHWWRTMTQKFGPSLVIDAGVNYGEIVLSTAYDSQASVTVIDANEVLRPYLTRSIEEHPNGSQFRIVNAIASDQLQSSVTFYVDKVRSGNSSAFHLGERAFREITIPSVTVDSLFDDRTIKDDTLLFKLDVEGYEWNVLRGMSRILKETKEVAGIIEFNMSYMEKKGVDLRSFVSFLSENFLLFAPGNKGALTEIKAPYYESALQYFARDKDCNDLILLTNLDQLAKLKS
ncbi:FkbM family methyltransferase [Paenibacillus sp. NPDC057967]|uniref:FkbM family methyltransferase n=1 Tax=Paenibacillus sp. NPDC057967 TaxID=3346293 RepID=UPI0036DB917C